MKTKNTLLYAEFDRLLQLEKVEPADVQQFDPEQLEKFKQLVNLKLTRFTGDAYQQQLARYQAILAPEKAGVLVPAVTETHEFDDLLAVEKIERSQLQHLTPEKKKEFSALLHNKLAASTGADRDAFIEKISSLLDHEKMWEINHEKINNAINAFVHKCGTMPTKSHLVNETGLSKATVYKHIQSLKASPLLNEQNEYFALMTKQVLGKVLQTALHGDMAAAKLYLNTMSKQNTGTGSDIVINNQNNIQINSTILNQQTIQQLKPEQLQQIEEIIKRSLAEKNKAS